MKRTMSAATEPGSRFVTVNVSGDTFRLPKGDAMRLARAIRNLVKEELAAMKAATTEASTNDPNHLSN